MYALFFFLACFSSTAAGLISWGFGVDEGFVLRILYISTVLLAIYSAISIRNLKVSPKMSLVFWRSFFLICFVGLSFFITEFVYGYTHDVIRGTELSFFSVVMSAPFIALTWNCKNLLHSLLKILFPCIVILSIILLVVVYQSRNLPYMLMLVDYQNLSYTASFCIGMLLFYLRVIEVEKKQYFYYVICVVFLFLNIFILFSGGGKGAFVSVCFLSFYFLAQNKKNFLLFLLLFLLGVCLFIFFYDFIVSISGFNRIFGNLTSDNVATLTSGRDSIYILSWTIIKEKIFLGGGAGTGVYETGYYAHNFFLDVLLDWGFAGFITVLGFCFAILKKVWMLRDDRNITFLFILFIISFTKLMFSSSVYCDFNIWFSSIAILAYDNQKSEGVKNG